MKKKFLAVALTTVLSSMLVACGDTSDLRYLKDFEPAKYVKLEEYKGVEIPLSEPTVSDEQIESYINSMLSYYPTVTDITDRAVQEGDTVNLDYEGKRDGVAFDGGTAQGASLTIGSGQFIDGFEDGMIGMEIGETRDLNLTFPENYDNEDLAGAEVVFTVTVNSIAVEEPAELNDEFVQNLVIEGVSTVDEYKDYVYNNLLNQYTESFQEEKIEAAIDATMEQTTFKKVPTGMVDRFNEVLLSNIEAYAQMFGMEVGDYVAAVYECDVENYEEELKNQSELMAQRYIMLAAIAEQEGLTVTEEEMEAAMIEEAANYGYTEVEDYKAAIDVEAYREYMIYQKAGEFLADNGVLVGAPEETEAE